MPIIDPWLIHPDVDLERYTSYWFATICRLGYLRPNLNSPFFDALTVAGFNSVQRLDPPLPSAPACYVLRRPDTSAVVVINGTTVALQYLADWMGQALQDQPPFPGQVNRFFGTTFNRVLPAVLDDLVRLPPSRLTFIGHSFGGSVASLFAKFLGGGPVVRGCWSIGAPRVGDSTFANNFTIPYTRITNSGDPVPTLPPAFNPIVHATWFPYFRLPGQYWHPGTRWHLGIDGIAERHPEVSTGLELTVTGASILVNAHFGIFSHDTPEYIRRLRIGIPVPWRTPDPLYPGIKELDDVNWILNGQVDWIFTVPTVAESRQPPNRGPFAVEGVCP